MEWVASSLALYVGSRSIQLLSADPHSSAASSRLNWHPRRFKWTRPFLWKTKSGFCACAMTFRTCYTNNNHRALRGWTGELRAGTLRGNVPHRDDTGFWQVAKWTVPCRCGYLCGIVQFPEGAAWRCSRIDLKTNGAEVLAAFLSTLSHRKVRL